jgi:HSP20 family protein
MSKNSILPSLWGKNDGDGFSIQSLRRDIDRAFDQFKTSFPASLGLGDADGGGLLAPKIDVSETEKQVEIVAEIPGVDKDQIDVSITNEVLTIKGEKKTECEEKENDYHLIERSSGSFYRSVPLGFDVDPDKVETDFKDGVLTLVLPKPPELAEKSKKIKIKSAT